MTPLITRERALKNLATLTPTTADLALRPTLGGRLSHRAGPLPTRLRQDPLRSATRQQSARVDPQELPDLFRRTHCLWTDRRAPNPQHIERFIEPPLWGPFARPRYLPDSRWIGVVHEDNLAFTTYPTLLTLADAINRNRPRLVGEPGKCRRRLSCVG